MLSQGGLLEQSCGVDCSHGLPNGASDQSTPRGFATPCSARTRKGVVTPHEKTRNHFLSNPCNISIQRSVYEILCLVCASTLQFGKGRTSNVRSVRVILYACAATPQFGNVRASNVRSFRDISCRPLGPLSCLAQGDNPKDEAEPLPWPGRMPRATRRRLGFKMRSICRLRKFSWSRVSDPSGLLRHPDTKCPFGLHEITRKVGCSFPACLRFSDKTLIG